MNRNLQVLDEPQLEFRYKQSMLDPHDGLLLFGPHGPESSAHPEKLTLGVIGTPEGVKEFIQWCRIARGPIYPGEGLDPVLWPVFPGFEVAFASSLPYEPAWTHELDFKQLKEASSDKDPNKRAFGVVDKYMDAIRLTEKKEEPFSVLVCVVPDIVYENCRPQSKLIEGVGYSVSKAERGLRRAGQTDFFDKYAPEIYEYSVDFRRQIKARSMQYKIPIQIVRESSLTFDRRRGFTRLSPPSDLAWNLTTTVYYKAGGKPWRLAAARPGVCYIGIVFRRVDPTSDNRTACCAAQMFLDSGDGVVFLGDYGPWYSPRNKQFHLTRDAARKLLQGVLRTYDELEGQPLKEIFLHSRSEISEDEYAGYVEACPAHVSLAGVRVRKEIRGLRMFREGSRPMLRGALWCPSPKGGYLWASGFVPRLRTYPGWESPVPLRIDIQHGEADIVQVSKDILALTKLNYNACRYGDSEPVTIGFSDAVGEILVSNPTITTRSPKFKFYI